MQVRLNAPMGRRIETLAQRLKVSREKRGLTQGKLAQLAGMKQPDISKIEQGLIQQTTGIARLAASLHVPVSWLETGAGNEPAWEIVDATVDWPHTHFGVAHALSPGTFQTALCLTWEQLMTNADHPRSRAGTEAPGSAADGGRIKHHPGADHPDCRRIRRRRDRLSLGQSLHCTSCRARHRGLALPRQIPAEAQEVVTQHPPKPAPPRAFLRPHGNQYSFTLASVDSFRNNDSNAHPSALETR